MRGGSDFCLEDEDGNARMTATATNTTAMPTAVTAALVGMRLGPSASAARWVVPPLGGSSVRPLGSGRRVTGLVVGVLLVLLVLILRCEAPRRVILVGLCAAFGTRLYDYLS